MEALQQLDEHFLDYPLVLIHGKQLQKPILIAGLLPAPTPVDRQSVESKPPSLLTLGDLTNLLPQNGADATPGED
jgi:hypothetical protein